MTISRTGLGAASALALLLALGACGKDDDDGKAAKPAAASQQGVVLDAGQSRGLGLTTVPAQAAQYAAERSGYGTVVSLDTIAQADSDLLSAQATAAQSQAAAKRARYLFTDQGGAVSRESMEAAIAKAGADQAALALAQRKAEAIFGHAAPWKKDAAHGAIMADLASGRQVLVRVTFPLGELTELPQSLTILRLGGGGKRWTSRRVWEAPADATFPGRGIFALLEGSDLAQNDHVTGLVAAGAPQPGVVVPAAAVVLSDGASWVYVARGSGHYVRVEVDTARQAEGGYILTQASGMTPGQPVVVGGAGLLLAREVNPSTQPAD